MLANRRMNAAVSALLLALCFVGGAGRQMVAAQPLSPLQAEDVVRRYEVGYISFSLRYGYVLLDVALERSVARYGPYRIEPATEEMSVARLHREVAKGDLVNVVVHAAVSTDSDDEVIPIDIALDKGLSGYRVAFIRPSDQDRVAQVRNLADLRRLRIGIGQDWNDVPIYKYNNLDLVAAIEFESLLLMQERGRFELLPRPATGILSEYDGQKDRHPGLVVEQHLLIHYPLGMYAFVSKSTPRLAERIRYGLQEMQKDGSFDEYFNKHLAQAIADLGLPQRTVIELENPYLPTWAKIPPLEWHASASVPNR